MEDYRWTERNYDNMVTQSEELSRWWSDVEPLRKLDHTESIVSIDTFLAQIETIRPDALASSIADFVDAIFDVLLDSKIRPVLDQRAPPLLEPSKRLFNALTKWIISQLAITSKYHFLSESVEARRVIISHMHTLENGEMALNDVTATRTMFEKNLISHDHEQTFAELYPLFETFDVNYDKMAVHYENRATILGRIFNPENYRQKQLAQSTSFLGCSLITSETFYNQYHINRFEQDFLFAIYQ